MHLGSGRSSRCPVGTGDGKKRRQVLHARIFFCHGGLGAGQRKGDQRNGCFERVLAFGVGGRCWQIATIGLSVVVAFASGNQKQAHHCLAGQAREAGSRKQEAGSRKQEEKCCKTCPPVNGGQYGEGSEPLQPCVWRCPALTGPVPCVHTSVFAKTVCARPPRACRPTAFP